MPSGGADSLEYVAYHARRFTLQWGVNELIRGEELTVAGALQVDNAQDYIHQRFVDNYVTELKVKVADKCFQKCFDPNNNTNKLDTSENGCQAMCCDRYRELHASHLQAGHVLAATARRLLGPTRFVGQPPLGVVIPLHAVTRRSPPQALSHKEPADPFPHPFDAVDTMEQVRKVLFLRAGK